MSEGASLPAVPPEPPASSGEDDQPRRYPSTLGGLLYLGVLAATAVGLGIVAVDDWRLGIKWVGGALIAAALCRLLLPGSDAGMLRVRNRWVDSVLLAGVGVAVIALSTSIPNQPV